ncbi:MAG: type II toxin-antitoxin system RelE/ParE family toxin [Alphaproteobacteria bacterium]|nr:type II toxin-antitoxin system RelE/ParE family toxin [Alphaproteobacteria bacterium]
MTGRVVFSRRAAAEVEEIAAFLAEQGQAAADRFARALQRAQQQLSQFPNSGAPGLRPGARRLVFGDYILSYRRRGSEIEIFAVRHARRRDARTPTG